MTAARQRVRHPSSGRPRRLVLRNFWSPGDAVMLTAAVRDLHRCNPGRFVTDVRSACHPIWRHNPNIVPLDEQASGVETLDCEYPLIQHANTRPVHCLNGFANFLSERLGVPCDLSECRGDVPLSNAELRSPNPIRRWAGADVPFWLLAAGGKFDYTIKWWDHARFQAVVQHFAGRLLFVQVGLDVHHHPPLEGVLDLRGRTNLRHLVRWVHHADGVLCPVTSLMHLAAAVPVRKGRPALRPCVVVAGGREPPHWEAYPGHQFIHTVGLLPCCATGGCWRARTVPLHDGDERDAPRNLCLNVVQGLPRCMDLISAEEVIRRIELYLQAGGVRPLSRVEARQAAAAIRCARQTPHRRSPAPGR